MSKSFQWYKNQSIKNKLLIIVAVQLIFLCAPLIVFSYVYSTNVLKDKAVDYCADILHSLSSTIIEYTSNIVLISDEILYDHQLVQILQEAEDGGEGVSYSEGIELNSVLKRAAILNNDITAICLFTVGGHYFSSGYNGQSGRIVALYDTFYANALKTEGSPIWSIGNDDSPSMVFLTRMVLSPDNFEEIGLLVLAIDGEKLMDRFRSPSAKDMQSIGIITRDKHLLGIGEMPLVPELTDKMLSNHNGAYMDEKQKAIIIFQTVRDLDWALVAYTPLSRLCHEIDMIRNAMVLLFLTFASLFVVVSIFMAGDIVRPLNRLVSSMSKVDGVDVFPTVSVDREDEIGFLSNSFNKMSEKLQHLMKSVYQEQITRKEAQIKALQSQINPHFLYNTLDTINWMAIMAKNAEISDMVSSLSVIMEAAITRDDKLISLKDELYFLDCYFAIMKKRYEDKLTVIKEIDSKTLSMEIPRLLIQPICENAIAHGISRKKEGGIIKITTRIHEDNVLIEIFDNGVGLDEKLIEQYSEVFSGQAKHNGNKSLALLNVDRRIKLFFGNGYGLSIQSEIDEYTRVTISLPKGDVGYV